MSATLKMKYCFQRKYIDKVPKKYSEVKKTSINTVKKILKDTNNSYISFFASHKKKDDLGDVLLQGLAVANL